jgi:phage terminase large subunit-like protein
MNDRAVVQFLGTTTMYGSIMHGLVLAASTDDPPEEWITDERVVPHYYPAIMVDDDGAERSLWPQRWSLPYLQSIRNTRQYAMNFANMPPSADAGFWSPEDIIVTSRTDVSRRVLMIDPAVTSTTKSDYTGLAVTGIEPGPTGRAVTEYARQMKLSPEGLRRTVSGILRSNPSIRVVGIEVNNGGDHLLDTLAPTMRDHPGVEIVKHSTSWSKPDRFHRGLDWCQRGWWVLGRELPALTTQMLAYPDIANDDVVDVATAGAEYWLADRDMNTPIVTAQRPRAMHSVP